MTKKEKRELALKLKAEIEARRGTKPKYSEDEKHKRYMHTRELLSRRRSKR